MPRKKRGIFIMKYISFLSLLLVFIACKQETAQDTSVRFSDFKNGDIIFQTSTSAQSKAIQLATHSKYSHCGIIYEEDSTCYVFEAIQPVKKTLLREWIARGQGGNYVLKRLKDTSVLTPEALQKMRESGKALAGKNYDLYFEWSNSRIYCSELVWKLYKDATGLEVGHLQKLSDFDLSSPAVQQKLKERYGNNIPKDEKVISPAVIFDSELLTTVREK